MNNLPLNGRIAIIDDQLSQALPLINIFSQNQRPVTYFSGEVKYLPDEENRLNDIRVLFLDINLIDDSEHEDKVLKAKLVPVLNRIIAEDNFPYVIIYWSREDVKAQGADKYKNLVEDIFSNDLKNKKPIGYLSAQKILFFNLDGTKTDDFEDRIGNLFAKINELIDTIPSYCHLLNWETSVHHAADKTLQEIFNGTNSQEHWADNANFLIYKLGESYAGVSNYKNFAADEKTKSSFQAFNTVFSDSLEYIVNNVAIPTALDLTFNEANIQSGTIYSINKKLLISDDKAPMDYSGAVVEDLSDRSAKIFDDLLNNILSIPYLNEQIIIEHGQLGTNAFKRAMSKKRQDIRDTWKRIYFVLTPLCDFVQNKNYNIKAVKGILMRAIYVDRIDNKSEAIFISPKFAYDDDTYVIVLHFRYFFTASTYKGVKGLSPLFRVRQQLFAEVQSKLARHVNRQGILYLE